MGVAATVRSASGRRALLGIAAGLFVIGAIGALTVDDSSSDGTPSAAVPTSPPASTATTATPAASGSVSRGAQPPATTAPAGSATTAPAGGSASSAPAGPAWVVVLAS